MKLDLYRITLETFKDKLELASKGNTKELRLNKVEIVELHQAMTSLLLINAELRLTNDHLKAGIKSVEFDNKDGPVDMDGGGFQDDL